jgi:deoxyribonuclease V
MRWIPTEGTLEAIEQHVVERPVSFPYIPGLLSFREIPALADALERLEAEPHLLLCDGHGLAHPRRFGLASHVGVLTGIPTIGVAKNRLIGGHGWLEEERGAWQPLLDSREVIGAVLRTRSWVAPVYVSVGNLITLQSALRAVLALATLFRLPEPARLAHQATGGN